VRPQVLGRSVAFERAGGLGGFERVHTFLAAVGFGAEAGFGGGVERWGCGEGAGRGGGGFAAAAFGVFVLICWLSEEWVWWVDVVVVRWVFVDELVERFVVVAEAWGCEFPIRLGVRGRRG